MTKLEDFLRPTQEQLFKRLCKKFKGKTTVGKGNFILVHGVAPVMLVALTLTRFTKSRYAKSARVKTETS